MTNEKWQNLKGDIADKFGVEEEKTEELENQPGEIEIIIFTGPLGKIKLARTTRPLVINKKTQYSRRIGSSVNVEYVYSDTEKIHELKIYKWNEGEGEWEELKTKEEFAL